MAPAGFFPLHAFNITRIFKGLTNHDTHPFYLFCVLQRCIVIDLQVGTSLPRLSIKASRCFSVPHHQNSHKDELKTYFKIHLQLLLLFAASAFLEVFKSNSVGKNTFLLSVTCNATSNLKSNVNVQKFPQGLSFKTPHQCWYNLVLSGWIH